MRRNLLWCILGTQFRERRLWLGRSVQLPPCPPIPTPSQEPRRHQLHWRSGQYHKAAAGDSPLHHPKHPPLPRRLAPVGIYTCDHIATCPIRGRRVGTPGTHSTGPDRLRPLTVQRSHHSRMANRPRYARAFKGPGAGSAKHNPRLKLTRAPKGMAGRRDPPGHSCCLGTGPTTHNPHISRGTPRAAGR